MKLNLLSWNINFIHDNWVKRLNNINNILEKEVENCDIIAIQEATLPFSNCIYDVHDFLKNTNIEHFDCALLERNLLYKYLKKNFPKYKKYVTGVFDYLMNKTLYLCAYIFSKYGEHIKYLYFKHPYLSLLLFLSCPFIFLSSWYFLGMLTIFNKKIKYDCMRCKYVGNRKIQYSELEVNNKKIIFVNVHLVPGEGEKTRKERMKEIKEILSLCKNYKNVIIAGDFNSEAESKEYKYMKKKGYKSAMNEFCGEELNTFPCNEPSKCIDFVWIKGNIKVVNALNFGNIEASDHKGIKVTLDI